MFVIPSYIQLRNIKESTALFNVFSGDTHFIDNKFIIFIEFAKHHVFSIEQFKQKMKNDNISDDEVEQFLSSALNAGIIIEHQQ